MHPECGPACKCEYRQGYRAAHLEAARLMGEMYNRFKRQADPGWEPGEKLNADATLITMLRHDFFPNVPVGDIRAALKGTTGSEAERLQQAITKLGKA